MATDPEKWNAKETFLMWQQGVTNTARICWAPKVVRENPEYDVGDDISSRRRDM